MKSILLSVQPQWAKKILNGEKTIEVRKTAPKEVPFRVYVYCTKGKDELVYFYNQKNYKIITETSRWGQGQSINFGGCGNGKVVAEFIVNKVDRNSLIEMCVKEDAEKILKGTCLTKADIVKYLNCPQGTDLTINHKKWEFYGWHISDLKEYDVPLELGEFHKLCEYPNEGYECYPDNCNRCPWNTVTRPPQSYMFVRRR